MSSNHFVTLENLFRPRRKIKKERGNTFKVKIKKPKGKKKEKDKEKDDRKVKKKIKKTSSSGDLSQGETDEPLHGEYFVLFEPSPFRFVAVRGLKNGS